MKNPANLKQVQVSNTHKATASTNYASVVEDAILRFYTKLA